MFEKVIDEHKYTKQKVHDKFKDDFFNPIKFDDSEQGNDVFYVRKK